MSEASESSSSYVTPDPEPEPQPLPPTFMDRESRTVGVNPRAVGVATPRKWVRTGFIFGWGIAILSALSIKSCLYSPDTSGPPTDPEGVIREENSGCETNGRLAEPGTFGCQVREDIQGMGVDELAPRTYVEPLPEGQSGRVGYNRVNAEAATPVDLSPGLVLALQ